MPSERIQRRIDKLLDDADEAYSKFDWELAEERAKAALGLDPDNEDALAFIAGVRRMKDSEPAESSATTTSSTNVEPRPAHANTRRFKPGENPNGGKATTNCQ